MKKTPAPKPRRSRLLCVKVSEREYKAISDQYMIENLSSISDYVRKTALDHAKYQANPTTKNP